MQDILKDVGYLGLASRLKRLSDRLFQDCTALYAESGEALQPGQFPLMAALDRYGPLTITAAAQALGVSQPAATRAASELVKAGLADTHLSDDDKRRKIIALNGEGRALVERMKQGLWPPLEASVRALCVDQSGEILDQIAVIEARLAQRSMVDRVRDAQLEVLPFTDELARAFHDINIEWIEEMFVVEPKDREILENPRTMILDRGGEILFVRTPDLGVVGTCALQPHSETGLVELTKMGVRREARGRNMGAFLLRAVLEKAHARGFADRLYLLTNRRCAAAIHLYEKAGFVHDQEIMAQMSARYERCDVAMRYRG